MASTPRLRRPSRRRRGSTESFRKPPAPPQPPTASGGDFDSVNRAIDARIDERFDGETTRSSVAILASGFAVLMAAVAAVTVFVVARENTDQPATANAAAPAETAAVDISAEAGEGIEYEEYQRPDPRLPEPPAGPVKRFKVDVYEHVTKVADDLAPTRVWSYAINGKLNRGTGVSEPMVVTEGDRVEIELINGSSEEMNVKFPHSIDYHSSEVAPNEAFKTIPPGGRHEFAFTAKHPGVFMYHCATDPVLHHTGAGMVGMMVVKPKDLAPVDHELWITQQEFYLGAPGEDADMDKMVEKAPDVIAFNGYANQYQKHPIKVGRGETVRMYLMNAGPSIWSAFHVIGTVFDRTMIEGVEGAHAQTVNLAPSQGGWVEFTLDEEGNYPFVTHGFGDMVKGAVGVLSTRNAPDASGGGHSH